MPSSKWPDGAYIEQRGFYHNWDDQWGEVDYEETIEACDYCGQFHIQSPWNHGFSQKLPVIFTDGACHNNGRINARTGFGVAAGEYPHDQWSYSFTGPGERSSQKAELHAVTQGIVQAAEAIFERHQTHCWSHQPPTNAFVIATDSDYAIRGIIENLPAWKFSSSSNPDQKYTFLARPLLDTFQTQANGFRNLNGYSIRDEAEFRNLDATITEYENRGWSIGFWFVPRDYNENADYLAGNGARADQGPPQQAFVSTFQVVEVHDEW